MTQVPHIREGRLVLLFAGFAGLRVLLFSAAFPFFANIDEHRHVDVVLKYARGFLPAPGGDAYEPEMAVWLALYGSPEYHLEPGHSAPPPSWRRAREAVQNQIESQEAFLGQRHNLEANEAPVYYALAAAWMKLGRSLGARGAGLLFFVRALHAVAFFALVGISWWWLREVYPDDAFMRLGVPGLLAVFPQDAAYYVTRDALSPLVMGVAFLLLLRISQRSDASPFCFAGAGLLLALAFLVKYTNLAVLVVAAALTISVVAPRGAEGRVGATRWKWALLWGVALLPIVIWLARNQLLFGELTGSALKVERMGWGRKSFAEISSHILFTPSGLWAFATDLLPHFWRGQLVWYREILAWCFADAFYTATSLLFVGLATLRFFATSRARRGGRSAHQVEAQALLAVFVSIATLAVLSLLFVFHETSNPSAAKPYFDQGRLISGALLPFAILYVRGIRVATSPLSEGAAGGVALGMLATVVLVALVSEVALSWPVFASEYNWFHLP